MTWIQFLIKEKIKTDGETRLLEKYFKNIGLYITKWIRPYVLYVDKETDRQIKSKIKQKLI